jgi:hypothetical protein
MYQLMELERGEMSGVGMELCKYVGVADLLCVNDSE